jgi:hypothetical protein
VRTYIICFLGFPEADMGRHATLDDTKKREICALTTAGMTMAHIAQYVGCARGTIRNERQRDPEFDQRVRRARMGHELTPLEAMRRAAGKYWRAAAWLLERDDRRQAARREAAAASKFTQTDLERLADEVRSVVKSSGIIEAFDEPPIADQIDQVFRQATPSAKGSKAARNRSACAAEAEPRRPTIEESIEFLERWAKK